MADPSSWRSTASAEHYAAHDFADFAQEFLRRNSDYRHEWAEAETRLPDRRRVWPDGGVFAFPCAPNAPPRDEPALWSPEHAAGVVILEDPAPPSGFSPPSGTGITADHLCGVERHLVLRFGERRVRLCIRHAPTRDVPTLVVPIDFLAPKRLAASPNRRVPASWRRRWFASPADSDGLPTPSTDAPARNP